MTKQVHIHIHRTKARDAGEGEGKWITLSPSGTHVKIDKGGEITAGPKGMTGKKPSELSSKPAGGSSASAGKPEHQTRKYSAGESIRYEYGPHTRNATVIGEDGPNHVEVKWGNGRYSIPRNSILESKTAAKKAPHDPTGMAHAGRPQGTAAVQARIDAKKAAAQRRAEREHAEFLWRQQQKHAPSPSSGEVVRLGNQAPVEGVSVSSGKPKGSVR